MWRWALSCSCNRELSNFFFNLAGTFSGYRSNSPARNVIRREESCMQRRLRHGKSVDLRPCRAGEGEKTSDDEETDSHRIE